jgi:hypothetical protein
MNNAIITFVIPVRHPENARDWQSLKLNLQQTAKSIAAQTNAAWKGVIVANDGADLPVLPEKFEVVRVNFPPNPHYDLRSDNRQKVYDAVRLDKGRRILKGILDSERTPFYMVVDDDDFVSNKIAQFVSQHPKANGWKINKGYVWAEGGTWLYALDTFDRKCGTSMIVNSKLYSLPERFEEADETYIKEVFGSHIMLAPLLVKRQTPLAKLPFRGAIYRVGHSGAHSKSENLIRTFITPKYNWKRPWRFATNFLNFRRLKDDISEEFFGRR